MNPLGIAIAGILFVFGLFVGRSSTSPVLGTQTSVQHSQQPTPTSTTATATPIDPLPTPMPTAIPATEKPLPSPTQSPEQTELSAFRYPNATIQKQSDTTLTVQSSDDPALITQWYEEKIKSLGFGSRSVAKTNSNGNIEHKMGAVKNGKRVAIAITKTPATQNTTVTISVSQSSNNDIHIEIKNTD